jgi:biotin operon repressor
MAKRQIVETVEMTKEEMLLRIAELESKNKTLKESKTDGVKEQVLRLLQSGYNSIEAIAEELDKTSKNISTNLTYIRKELAESGQTIVSYRKDNKTYLSIQDLSIFGI